jgi:tRNA dimethylallyltransferase
LRALLEGLAEAPQRSEDLRRRLREVAQRRGEIHLHKMLKRLDLSSAARIAPRDMQKIIRAIEMRVLSGKAVSRIHQGGREPLQGYTITKIGLNPPRDKLYARINDRVHAMLTAGWLDEVRRLIAAGIPTNVKPFEFIGYGELQAHLEGRLPLYAAIAQIQQATRNFAKRQLTWFRRETSVRWLDSFGDDAEATRVSLQLVS